MKKIVYILLLVVVAGCNPAAKIDVIEIGAPRLKGMGAVSGQLEVENRGKQEVVVESAEFVVKVRQKELATARLVEPLRAPARDITEIDYELVLSRVSLAGLQTLMRGPRDAVVDVEMIVQLGKKRKKVEVKNVPIEKIIANFAP